MDFPFPECNIESKLSFLGEGRRVEEGRQERKTAIMKQSKNSFNNINSLELMCIHTLCASICWCAYIAVFLMPPLIVYRSHAG